MNYYTYQNINEKNISIPLILVAKSRYDILKDKLASINTGKMSTFKI